MDVAREPRQRCWQKRRWGIAAAAWLLLSPPLLYVFGSGPAVYALVRGWLPRATYVEIYGDRNTSLFYRYHAVRPYYLSYCEWWRDLTYLHEAD